MPRYYVVLSDGTPCRVDLEELRVEALLFDGRDERWCTVRADRTEHERAQRDEALDLAEAEERAAALEAA